MDGLSLSAWLVLILGFVICFGGAFWCVLIIMGKEPGRIFEWTGISRLLSHPSKGTADDVIYRPFEYMDKGPKEKGVGITVLLVLLIIAWGLGVFEEAGSEGGYSDTEYDVALYDGALDPINGQSEENTEHHEFVTIDNQTIHNITFTLSWDDEDASAPGYVNGPDEFSLGVTTSWGVFAETPMTENDGNGHGEISLTFTAPGEFPDTESAGDYDINITMGEAEDQSLGGGGTGIIFIDDGNSWTLTIEYDYYKKPL